MASNQNKSGNDKLKKYLTSSKTSSFPKPDFSPITKQQCKYEHKVQGSYKKVREEVPDSPNKTPISKFFTPAQIKGKNLFGTAPIGPFRKLNFDDVKMDNTNKCGLNFNLNKQFYDINSTQPTQQTNNSKKNNFLDSLDFMDNENEEELYEESKDNLNEENGVNVEYTEHEEKDKYIKNGRLEEYNVLRVLHNDKYGSVSKVESMKNGQISCIKSILKNSGKNSFKTTIELLKELPKLKEKEKTSKFCVIYNDFWIEEEISEIEEGAHFTEKISYIKYKYYKNGDLLDFLENLEWAKYKFTEDFYWDLIFEMICGLIYFHKSGFMHLNVKPPNFLVDADGYIGLNDFGLSVKMANIKENEDVPEGDTGYISPEIFYRTNSKNISKKIDCKSDIYSLGLSILEIMAKIDLPKNGPLWTEIRKENFEFPDEFLNNWNIKETKDFILLIKDMLLPLEKRLNLTEIINKYPKLKERYDNLIKDEYMKSTSIPTLNNEERKLSLKAQPSKEKL